MQTLKQNILSIYGDKGKHWLDALPDVLNQIAEKHNLSQLSPVANMSFNFVATGYYGEQSIVLKVGIDTKDLANEASCLKAFTPKIAAEIIVSDDNMIIMKRIVPGTTLKDYFLANKESHATTILCAMTKKLHATALPTNHNYPHVSDILKTLDQTLPIPNKILSKAKSLRNTLLQSSTEECLLHGDLHHDNILNNGDRWLVIDPKGFIGDPAFELAAYLSNPIPELLQHNNVKILLANRIRLCSEQLDIPEQKIYDWLYVKLVLCWAWCLNDHIEPTYWQHFLNLIER